ncbi:MAG: hypothetical protein ABSC55_17105 [Syntrophorhabdales bacterium]|jgi:hypothetical protein
MSLGTYQRILPAIMQDTALESAAGQAYGAMLDSMCRVVSICLPIFDRAMQSLTEGIHGRLDSSR